MAFVAALGLTLAACGGTDSSSPAATPAPAPAPAPAESPEEAVVEFPLEGQLITFLVGTSPGGGFDSYARLIAPFLADELKADVTVSNMPGAGGLIQLNTLWTSRPDGTVIGIVNGSGVAGSILGGAAGVAFDLSEFDWIGRIAGEPRVLTVNPATPYESAEQLVGLGDRIRFAATGPGGGTYNDGVLSCALFAMTDCDVISGFGGSSEARLAVTAGEATALLTTADSVLSDVAAGDQRALAILSTDRLAALPDVPTFAEISGLSAEGREIAAAMVAIIELGRSLATVPGTPEPVLNELRRAFSAVMESQAFQEEAARQKRPMGYLEPEDYLELVRTALGAPQAVRDILAAGIE